MYIKNRKKIIHYITGCRKYSTSCVDKRDCGMVGLGIMSDSISNNVEIVGKYGRRTSHKRGVRGIKNFCWDNPSI